MPRPDVRGILVVLIGTLVVSVVLNPALPLALALTAVVVVFGFLEWLGSRERSEGRIEEKARTEVEIMGKRLAETRAQLEDLTTTVTQINNRTRKPGQS